MRTLLFALVLLLVGASASAAPAAPLPSAPELAVEYLVHVKPMPKQVLVVGTPGRLSAELVAAGMSVDTIAEDRLESRGRRYDAVVWDIPDDPTPVIAAPTVLHVGRHVTDPKRLAHETEDLYLTAEMPDGTWTSLRLDTPARPLASADGVSAWPPEDGLTLDPHQDAPQKTVRAFGYLVASPSGVRLELTHDRSEASVVYLTGAVAERDLRPRAHAGTLVLDRRDASLSAPVGSMLPVYGPGWLIPGKHAIVASDALVAVHGKASFLGRGKLPHDPTRSGLSWTLEVGSVERVLDRAWWEPHEKAHLARLDAARTAIAASRWALAADELDASVAALTAAFGVDAPDCNWILATRDLAKRIRTIDADPRSMNCFEDSYIGPGHRALDRPVPHPADLALWATYKKAKEERYFANIVLGPDHRHWSAVPADRPVMCWWESTVGDPGYPTARHREVAKTYLFYAPEIRRR